MKDNRIFAPYKGDEYLMDGTIREIAKARGVKEDSIRFLTRPAYTQRVEKLMAEATRPSRGYLTMVYLEGKWE